MNLSQSSCQGAPSSMKPQTRMTVMVVCHAADVARVKMAKAEIHLRELVEAVKSLPFCFECGSQIVSDACECDNPYLQQDESIE